MISHVIVSVWLSKHHWKCYNLVRYKNENWICNEGRLLKLRRFMCFRLQYVNHYLLHNHQLRRRNCAGTSLSTSTILRLHLSLSKPYFFFLLTHQCDWWKGMRSTNYIQVISRGRAVWAYTCGITFYIARQSSKKGERKRVKQNKRSYHSRCSNIKNLYKITVRNVAVRKVVSSNLYSLFIIR